MDREPSNWVECGSCRLLGGYAKVVVYGQRCSFFALDAVLLAAGNG